LETVVAIVMFLAILVIVGIAFDAIRRR